MDKIPLDFCLVRRDITEKIRLLGLELHEARKIIPFFYDLHSEDNEEHIDDSLKLYKVFSAWINDQPDLFRVLTLSIREMEVVSLLSHNSKEIESKLFISNQTVRFHISNVNKKLGTMRRAQIAIKFLNLRWELKQFIRESFGGKIFDDSIGPVVEDIPVKKDPLLPSSNHKHDKIEWVYSGMVES